MPFHLGKKESSCRWQNTRLTVKSNGVLEVTFCHIQVKLGCSFLNTKPYSDTPDRRNGHGQYTTPAAVAYTMLQMLLRQLLCSRQQTHLGPTCD